MDQKLEFLSLTLGYSVENIQGTVYLFSPQNTQHHVFLAFILKHHIYEYLKVVFVKGNVARCFVSPLFIGETQLCSKDVHP